MRRLSLEDRFFKYVHPEPNTGCWLWGGAAWKSGYGMLGVSGKLKKATHVYLQLAGRPLPEGMLACHSCDFPPCVNPDHLFIGTQQDNLDDASAKGRLRNKSQDATHCKRGHEFTPENTVRTPLQRYCRICKDAVRIKCVSRNAVKIKQRYEAVRDAKRVLRQDVFKKRFEWIEARRNGESYLGISARYGKPVTLIQSFVQKYGSDVIKHRRRKVS